MQLGLIVMLRHACRRHLTCLMLELSMCSFESAKHSMLQVD